MSSSRDVAAKARSEDAILITRAIKLACIKHRDQTRKDTRLTPYISHPFTVMTILEREAEVSDATVLAAAILHDVIEDTIIQDVEIYDALGPKYGLKVLGMVQECSDPQNLTREERRAHQINKVASLSHGAKLIKLADKLANLRDLMDGTTKTKDEIRDYHRFTSQVVANLRGTCPPLEEAIMEILDSVHTSVSPFS